MRDSREKGAGMRDQDPPFQTLLEYLTDHLVDPLDRSLLFGDWHESGNKIGIKEVNQADYSHKVHEVINNATCLRIIG